MNDLQLLQKFEPVVCFTAGELFFPCAIDGYLQRFRDDLVSQLFVLRTGFLGALILVRARLIGVIVDCVV